LSSVEHLQEVLRHELVNRDHLRDILRVAVLYVPADRLGDGDCLHLGERAEYAVEDQGLGRLRPDSPDEVVSGRDGTGARSALELPPGNRVDEEGGAEQDVGARPGLETAGGGREAERLGLRPIVDGHGDNRNPEAVGTGYPG